MKAGVPARRAARARTWRRARFRTAPARGQPSYRSVGAGDHTGAGRGTVAGADARTYPGTDARTHPEPTPELTPEITPEPTSEPTPEIVLFTDDTGMEIRNKTDLEADIAALMAEPLVQKLGAEGPQILIIHTHGTEAYLPSAGARSAALAWRRRGWTSKPYRLM